MSSMDHELLVEFLRHRPALLAWLLDRAGVTPPPGPVTLVAGDLRDTQPATLAADLVALLGAPEPSLAVVGEVQLTIDASKKYSWSAYPVLVFRRHRIRTALVVVTPFHDVAAWARRSIDVGPGIRVTPLVVGPDEIPVITDPAAPLEFVTLSALAHGNDAPEVAIPVVRAFATALEAVREAPDSAPLYDFVVSFVSAAARKELERRIAHYEYKLPVFRNQLTAAREEGREESLKRLLRIQLTAKFGLLAPETEARIDGCRDLDLMERWATRAVTEATLDAVFAD